MPQSAYLPILAEILSEAAYNYAEAIDQAEPERARESLATLSTAWNMTKGENYAQRATRREILASLEAWGVPIAALEIEGAILGGVK
jgi:hypothetical protein